MRNRRFSIAAALTLVLGACCLLYVQLAYGSVGATVEGKCGDTDIFFENTANKSVELDLIIKNTGECAVSIDWKMGEASKGVLVNPQKSKGFHLILQPKDGLKYTCSKAEDKACKFEWQVESAK